MSDWDHARPEVTTAALSPDRDTVRAKWDHNRHLLEARCERGRPAHSLVRGSLSPGSQSGPAYRRGAGWAARTTAAHPHQRGDDHRQADGKAHAGRARQPDHPPRWLHRTRGQVRHRVGRRRTPLHRQRRNQEDLRPRRRRARRQGSDRKPEVRVLRHRAAF